MDLFGLLLLVPMVTATLEYPDSGQLPCEDFDMKEFWLLEGEAFHFVPDMVADMVESELDQGDFKWFRNSSDGTELITSDEMERIHHHGVGLLVLNISMADSGYYVATWRNRSADTCDSSHLVLNVLEANQREDERLFYGSVEHSGHNKLVMCPEPVDDVCRRLGGAFSWYLNFTLLPGRHEASVWLRNFTNEDQGVYTCVCTWTHEQHSYASSGSREVLATAQSVHSTLVIVSPTEVHADEGMRVQISCSVFCGRNVEEYCSARWQVGGQDDIGRGYHQTHTVVTSPPSLRTVATAVLTIEEVSVKDFQTQFKCIGKGLYSTESQSLSLHPRGKITSLVIGGLWTLVVGVFAALMVKLYAVDLVLLFRPCLRLRCCSREDSKLYDAYVLYQAEGGVNTGEDTLALFVNAVLPAVLEEGCRYRLCIQGRDDIPGEDRLEMAEKRITQSRRLMVILAGVDRHAPKDHNLVLGGVDFQVGLHHALTQTGTRVILIQVGQTGPQGYAHLSPALRHLITKRAPLRWRQDSQGAASPNSRFWKNVRYLMPARPASTRAPSAVV
uniref:interleukin-1 receptor type 1-like isoform X2 n=1 Tax=Doryrhamphus excisus TaxID=161450 RepID=UPI0025ADEE17|nr:interleukin-1 receptor type 1-like isoform X2 [Doryrhamphus excisus]